VIWGNLDWKSTRPAAQYTSPDEILSAIDVLQLRIAPDKSVYQDLCLLLPVGDLVLPLGFAICLPINDQPSWF
jgi:hypothetical protein